MYGNETSEYAVLQAILAMRENKVNFIDYFSVIVFFYELRQIQVSHFKERLLENEISEHLQLL